MPSRSSSGFACQGFSASWTPRRDGPLELDEQLKDRGIGKVHFYLVNGKGQAGLQLAAKLLGLPWTLTGVAVGQSFEAGRPLADWSRLAADYLGFKDSLDSEEIETTFDYLGPGHSAVTQAGVDAIKLVASTEGIILDPTYTAKAMAKLMDDVRGRRFEEDDKLVFFQTGGIPILFEAAEELSNY